MPWRWQGMMYEGPVIRGAVTRESGEGDWSAWMLHASRDSELIGKFPTPEAAQRAVEERISKRSGAGDDLGLS
jgi:hypothetical protein